MSDRLQKILAHAGAVASRRKAEDLIREGRVTVNGQVATLGDSADPATDHIKLDGKRVALPDSYQYLLVNKPPEVMSTRSDPEGRPTVMDLVPPGLRKKLVPVGRLDYHTEGLILLTDDGDLANRVAHPRYGCTKVYEVKVKGEPEEKELEKVRAGLAIRGRKTAPARVTRWPSVRGPRVAKSNTWWVVELSEGRTRQIREMFLRIGHPVQRLRRAAIGPLRDPHLAPGKYRELSDGEVEHLRRSTRARGRRPEIAAQKGPKKGPKKSPKKSSTKSPRSGPKGGKGSPGKTGKPVRTRKPKR